MSSTLKSIPLTKNEVHELIQLIESHPVVFSKATNVANNRLKEKTWDEITAIFNATVAEVSRKPETLRLKWENLKKAARKRADRIRNNNLKTGGGIVEHIPPDDALDRVAAMLGPSSVGFTALYGGDVVIEVVEVTEAEMVDEVAGISQNEVPSIFAMPAPSPPMSLPVNTPQPSKHNRKLFFQATRKGKLKRQAIADDVKKSQKRKNDTIADYYEERKKQEAVIFILKKRKLALEIQELEKRINS